MTTFPVAPARLGAGYPLKRAIDFTVALCLLVVSSPILAASALLVRISSPGPIFFRQTRLGLHERPFEIFKFRSMRVDAAQTGPAFTTAGDPRITRIGRLLRKTSLDELPQLLNVLRGDMSLFGPRPYVGFEMDGWPEELRSQRSAVRPGISGLAQVAGRSSLDPESTRRCDLEYVERCSLLFDIKLCWMTLVSVLRPAQIT